MAQDTVAPWAEPVLRTVADLALMPEDGWSYELVAGRLVRMPPTGFDHGRVESRIDRALGDFVEEHGLGVVLAGEVGFQLNRPNEPHTVLAPDIAFVASGRIPAAGTPEARGYPQLVPDLVVEIVSASQGQPEMAAKARLWLSSGVRLAWLIWPHQQRVDIWRPGASRPAASLGPGEMLSGEDVVPGFAYSIDRLFGESTSG